MELQIKAAKLYMDAAYNLPEEQQIYVLCKRFFLPWY
jgi:hypothetical protein